MADPNESSDFPGKPRGRGDTITVADALPEETPAPTVDEVETGAKKRPTYAADNAVAVNCNDFAALIEHARNTGAEELAAKYPHF